MLSKTLLAAFTALASAQSDIPLSPRLNNILSHAQQGPLYTYPTSLTQGIVPKAFHSHNDYWRPLPFYSALSVGAVSVEADVWLYNSTLHVGHEESALTSARTFDSLYIQPILSVLHQQNPPSIYLTGALANGTRNGVYDTAGGQTLYLFVDVKTNGTTTWPVVVKALQPLREAGYLTTFNGTGVTPGPVTVIGTGNTPLNQVQGVEPRDYFWDAPVRCPSDEPRRLAILTPKRRFPHSTQHSQTLPPPSPQSPRPTSPCNLATSRTALSIPPTPLCSLPKSQSRTRRVLRSGIGTSLGGQ